MASEDLECWSSTVHFYAMFKITIHFKLCGKLTKDKNI